MIQTQPNESRCAETEVEHILPLPNCCPMTHNPLAGSTITIAYTPKKLLLEVITLKAYIDSYQGGKGDVRSMEGMIQAITEDCAKTVKVPVYVTANLNLTPDQKMVVRCRG